MGTLLLVLVLLAPAWGQERGRGDHLEQWWGAQAEARERREMRQRDAELHRLRERVEAVERDTRRREPDPWNRPAPWE
jgi:hypothetical protein